MSGGHFDYIQYRIEDASEEIGFLIRDNNKKGTNEFGDPIYRSFSDEVIEKFKSGKSLIDVCAKIVKEIDYLVSGDNGEESFLKCWEENVSPKLKEIGIPEQLGNPSKKAN
jgi:hypothetical protein